MQPKQKKTRYARWLEDTLNAEKDGRPDKSVELPWKSATLFLGATKLDILPIREIWRGLLVNPSGMVELLQSAGESTATPHPRSPVAAPN